MVWWKDLHEWYVALEAQCPYYAALVTMRPRRRSDDAVASNYREARNGTIFRQVAIALVIQLIMGTVTVTVGAVVAVYVVQNDLIHIKAQLAEEKVERKDNDGKLEERIRFIERRPGP